MFKKFIFSILFFSVIFAAFPQETNYNLSSEAVISLITMEPSSQTNNNYGHSAIRIYDHKNNIDELFDLCFYDSRTHLYYKMHSRFIDALKKDQLSFTRNWYEQELNLNGEEKKKVFELLILSCNGPYYGFNEEFFTESAPIKILSMLKLILGNKLKLHSGNLTLRTIINNDFINQTTVIFNNIFLGANADNPKLTLDSCYTSEQLKTLVSNSRIFNEKNEEESLVLNERPLVSLENPDILNKFDSNKVSIIILSALLSLTLLLTLVQFYLNSKEISIKSFLIAIKASELIFFVLTGITGIAILTNDCLSNNILYKNNFNWLWLFPANLFMAFTLISVKKNILYSIYWLIIILSILTFGILVYFNIISQFVSLENILIMTANLIRSIYHCIRYYPFKTKKPVLNQEPAILN